jgi:Na+-transporting NADH:ubiquinone oxidoreductase subunit NqrC
MTQKVAAGKQIRMAIIVIKGSEPSQTSDKIAKIVGSTMIKRKGNRSFRHSIRGDAGVAV